MEPFIRNDQFNFIQWQAQNLIHGHSTVTDPDVIQALQLLTQEKVFGLFDDLTEEHKEMINLIIDVKDQADAALYLSRLKPYVIPFPQMTEATLKELFPKVKKLKTPSMEGINLQELSYLGWDDHGSHRKYIVTNLQDKLSGTVGTFTKSNQKGICTLCNGYEKVGMFMATTKKSTQSTVKRGNYICQDSLTCNRNITTLDLLDDFIKRLKQ